MNAPRRLLVSLSLGFGFALPAHAAIYNVEFCVEFETSFTDIGDETDYWTAGANQPALGIWLEVRHFGGTDWDSWTPWKDALGANAGCKTLALDSTKTYTVKTFSKAKVRSVEMFAYDDATTPALDTEIFYAFFSPSSSTTITLEIPASTRSAQLAVGTWVFSESNLFAGAETIEFYDDACCFAGANVSASTYSKTIIAHEIGHAIGHHRNESSGADTDSTANEDNCDGDNSAGGHSQVSKEFQSIAASEGWADFVSAWAWNDTGDSDCEYDRHYNSDFDLDIALDNSGVSGETDCDGIPSTGLETYVTENDWLEDLVNAADPAGCTGTLTNRGTQYDWLRFWWDMATDEGVPFADLVDIYDSMDPDDWNQNDTDVTEFPIERLDTACSIQGFSTECDNQVFNGQDH